MNKNLRCLLCAMSCCFMCSAQQINPSSGYSGNPGISMDWILGGLSDIAADETGTNSFAVQNHAILPAVSCRIYPTLTSGMVTVEISPADSTQFRAEVFDLTGSKTYVDEIIGLSSLQIDLTALPPGQYLFRVSDANAGHPVRNEKIIKY